MAPHPHTRVDLAAQAGGNIAGTRKDEAYTTDGGVTLIGYSDMNSRLASTSSALYANNQMKWILSAGPTTTKTKGEVKEPLPRCGPSP